MLEMDVVVGRCRLVPAPAWAVPWWLGGRRGSKDRQWLMWLEGRWRSKNGGECCLGGIGAVRCGEGELVLLVVGDCGRVVVPGSGLAGVFLQWGC